MQALSTTHYDDAGRALSLPSLVLFSAPVHPSLTIVSPRPVRMTRSLLIN